MADKDVRESLIELGVDPDEVLRAALEAKLRESDMSTSAPGSGKKVPDAESVETASGDDPDYLRSLPLALQKRKYLEGMIRSPGGIRKPRRSATGKGPSRAKRGRKSSQSEWKVEKLLDVRVRNLGEGLEKREFCVRWEGFGSVDDEWVDEYNLSQSYDLYPCEKRIKRKLNSLIKH